MFIKLSEDLIINRNRINTFYISHNDHIIVLTLYIAGHETTYKMELAYFHNSIMMREPETLEKILTYVQARVCHLFSNPFKQGMIDIKGLKNDVVAFGSGDLDMDMRRLGFNWSIRMLGDD